MNLDRPLFGRLTIGAKRQTLGRSILPNLMLRAAEILKASRVTDEVIHLELSFNKLPDSTTLEKLAIVEHEFAAQMLTDTTAESTFPGITIGRVTEAMSSPEYERYAQVCDPVKRLGLSATEISLIRVAYTEKFPDCWPYFPKWIDS